MKSSIKERITITSVRKVGKWDWFASTKCIVCLLPIKKEDLKNALKCPHCNGIAHADHILEWLRTHSSCPYCRAKLRRSKLLKAIN
ncbi:MAG: RING finger domain-containing protein [Candidatus Helarchaeota archaeon]